MNTHTHRFAHETNIIILNRFPDKFMLMLFAAIVYSLDGSQLLLRRFFFDLPFKSNPKSHWTQTVLSVPFHSSFPLLLFFKPFHLPPFPSFLPLHRQTIWSIVISRITTQEKTFTLGKCCTWKSIEQHGRKRCCGTMTAGVVAAPSKHRRKKYREKF